jgi:hypothetical protein
MDDYIAYDYIPIYLLKINEFPIFLLVIQWMLFILMLRKMAFHFTPGYVPFNPVFFGPRVGRMKKSLVIFSFVSRLFLNIYKRYLFKEKKSVGSQDVA